MDTASLQFLAFGLAAALISNFSRSRVWRSIVLFVASIVFLACWRQGWWLFCLWPDFCCSATSVSIFSIADGSGQPPGVSWR